MKVRYGRGEHTFDKPLTARRLLEKLDIVPTGVVVTVNGELVTADALIKVDDDVEIIRAISGGSGNTTP